MNTVNVRYLGDEPCWTPVPAADWKPQEVKALSQEDADFLLTNEMFKADAPAASSPASVVPPAPINTEVHIGAY